ncbi:hypothetical protein [Devosia sp.]|uniref:hypothetical protein n=1 Tax=Devosia sp. TaxID=1871048 RepID=UPI0026372319|nr:hypothetical protein [Devosia sp.]
MIRSFVRALTGLGRSSLAADHSEVGDEIPTVEAFDTQLRRMANHRQDTTTPLVAGSLQLVTLASLKDELGGSWPGFAERWRLIAGEEIQKELGPFDFFTNQDDSTFVVCFADLSVTEARAKAARTSQRIRTRLISEMPHASGRISVDRFVGEIDGGTVLDNGVPPAEALVSSLMKIRREADEASRLQRVASLREVRVLFQPAWDVRRSRSDMNRCLLHPLSGSAAMAQLQALTDKEELVDAVAHLDCLLFAGAMQCLHSALAQRGAKPDLVVPVHFSTLSGAGSSQDEYLVLLEMIPAHYQRYLSLEIHGVPASAEVFELLDVLDRVEPSVRRALLQLSPRDPRVGTHMDSVLWGLSIDLSKWRDSPAILQSWLPSYSRETTSKGLKTVAHGANSLGMAQAARNAGFDYICGSAIHLTSDAPKAPTFLNPLIGWELVSGEGKRRAQRQSSGNRG